MPSVLRMRKRNRLKDLVLYVGIALLILAAAIAYSVIAARMGASDENLLAWLWTIAAAAIVFGYLIYYKRKLTRRFSFWAFISALVATHFASYLLLFQWLKEVPLWWISFAIAPEFVVLGFVADKVFGQGNSKG
jgi:hypothetical protein